MRIDLEGDAQKAGAWIGFAKAKLRAMKDMMATAGLSVSSQWFKLEEGIQIFIESCMGADFIRISAEAGEKVYLCGPVRQSANWAWRTEKKGAWEKIDNESPSDAYASQPQDMCSDATGLYICGKVYPGPALISYWKTEKRSLDGKLLWETPVAGASDGAAVGIAEDATGVYICGAGMDAANPAYYSNWRIEKRNKTTGALIWEQEVALWSGGNHYQSGANSITVFDGALYIAGFYVSSGAIERRDPATGAMVWLKQVTTEDAVNIYDGIYYGVSCDADGVYVTGTRRFLDPSRYEWKTEKRSLNDGSVVWHKTYTDSGAFYNATGTDIDIDGDGAYCCGYDHGQEPHWRVEKRALINGDLLWEVRVTAISDMQMAAPNKLIVVPGGVYVAGWLKRTGGTTHEQLYMELIKRDDGSLISNYEMKKYPLYSAAQGITIRGRS